VSEPTAQPNPSPQPAASVPDLAAAALTLLARDGERKTTDAAAAWHVACRGAEGPDFAIDFDITCVGPDLPRAIEPAVASGALIASQRMWAGTYRLVIRATRLIVLDLHWKQGEPTRIMGFSRGAWERALIALART
jgi:hypothetical protein